MCEKLCRKAKWYLAIGLMFCFINTYSQKYPAADTAGSAYIKTLSISYPLRNELFLAGLKTEATDKKRQKYYEERYREIFNALNEGIRDGQMIYIPAISLALEKMLQEIKKSNPTVPKDVEILLLREDLPNAYTVGDNTLFVNMGLFCYLRNEDQVASVLTHEIGHLMLMHTLKALNYSYKRDKEDVANVKAIRSAQTKRADRAFDVLKNSIYKGGKIRRRHELQADSLGYVLFKNTKYRKTAFSEALEIIDGYDTVRPSGVTVETYRRFFDLPNQKFDEKWLKGEDFSSYNYSRFTEKFDEDSVSSHPKANVRIKYLSGIFPELLQKDDTLKNKASEGYTTARAAAQREYMPTLFFKEQYGDVIYVSLRHLQENPDDRFYKSWLGKGFQKIYEGRKNYQLNRYLDRIAPKDQTQSYMQFLTIMWNLKLEEIKAIADFYSSSL